MANENNNIEESKIKVMGDDYVRIVNAKTIFGWTLINGACKKKKPKKMKKTIFQKRRRKKNLLFD